MNDHLIAYGWPFRFDSRHFVLSIRAYRNGSSVSGFVSEQDEDL